MLILKPIKLWVGHSISLLLSILSVILTTVSTDMSAERADQDVS